MTAELFRLDPSTGALELFREFAPGADAGDPAHFAVLGDSLYFVATDPTHGRELWVTDGTAGGTRLAAELLDGAEGGLALPEGEQALTALGGKLYGSYAAGLESRLFAYDPASGAVTRYAGVRQPNRVVEGDGEVYASGIFSRLFRLAEDGGGATRLDAPVFGTLQPIGGVFVDQLEDEIAVIDPGADERDLLYDPGASPTGAELFAHRAGDFLYFNAQLDRGDGVAFRQLWRTDGTAAGLDSFPVAGGLEIRDFLAYGDALVGVSFGLDDELVVLDADAATPAFAPAPAREEEVGRGLALFDGGIAFAETLVPSPVYLKPALDQPAAPLATLPTEVTLLSYLVDLGDALLAVAKAGAEVRYYVYRLDCERAFESYDVCAGESVTVDGVEYSESTSQTSFARNPTGCDDVSGFAVSVAPVEAAALMTQPLEVGRDEEVTVRSAAGPLAWPDGSVGAAYTFATDSLSDGPYEVVARTTGPCPDTTSVTFAIGVGVGASEPAFARTLRLSPNPTRDRLRVSGLVADEVVGVFDASGRELRRAVATGTAVAVDLADLPAGAYAVRIAGARGTVTRRVVRR